MREQHPEGPIPVAVRFGQRFERSDDRRCAVARADDLVALQAEVDATGLRRPSSERSLAPYHAATDDTSAILVAARPILRNMPSKIR
jgi:hypothetical protein